MKLNKNAGIISLLLFVIGLVVVVFLGWNWYWYPNEKSFFVAGIDLSNSRDRGYLTYEEYLRRKEKGKKFDAWKKKLKKYFPVSN